MLRALCAEPYLFRPWEVGRLTWFQVTEILFADRDKKGNPVLDEPLGEDTGETTLAAEWRREWLRRGVTDPDALARLVAAAVAADEQAVPNVIDEED